MNLAKVRSAIGVTIAAVALLVAMTATASARVTLAWVPQETSVSQLAVAGLSPGLMSAGLGSVPAEQTYLDITQGNRVFDSLYKEPLPEGQISADLRIRGEAAVVERAESAPAEIAPGLLAATLEEAGKARAFRVRSAGLGELAALVRGLRGDDLLIAIERPPPPDGQALAIGIAGRDFDGNLTSGSTRLDGYVLATDVAPTILRRLDLAVPTQMSGQPIETEGSVDPAAIEDLGARLAVISERRGPVIGLTLLGWLLALTFTVLFASRGGSVRVALRIVALAVIYLPSVLLLAAALESEQGTEQLLALSVPPLLALLTLAGFSGYRALAVASATTVLAYAVDVVAGSPLTSLSLLGPNPGLGVRFYGIGNELEALLGVLVIAGLGAGIAGFAPRLSPRRCAAVFLGGGLAFAFVFAAGRFGADVGAAIVLPVGAAVAAAKIAARRRRTALLILAVPLLALALLALVDLVSGANAHLTRSVLDTGGLGDLADVAQRRLQLSAHSFVRPVLLAFLPLVAALAILVCIRRDRLAVWLRGRPVMRAGLVGAIAATAIGTLANDSGALLLEVGTAYLLVFTGYVWAEAPA